jgi:hypothetical protein
MSRLPKLFVLLACAACVEEANLEPFPEQIIPAAITATDTDLAPGENTILTVTLTNTLDQLVRLDFPTQCQALVFIRNAAGRVFTPNGGSYECATVPSSFSIEVGKSKTFQNQWGGGVEFGPAGTSERVPAGTYYAYAELRASNYHAIAFPITITVR